MKKRKATGYDGIPAKVWKMLKIYDILLKMVNEIKNEKNFLHWKIVIIIIIII
jgi:hypothetical protein